MGGKAAQQGCGGSPREVPQGAGGTGLPGAHLPRKPWSGCPGAWKVGGSGLPRHPALGRPRRERFPGLRAVSHRGQGRPQRIPPRGGRPGRGGAHETPHGPGSWGVGEQEARAAVGRGGAGGGGSGGAPGLGRGERAGRGRYKGRAGPPGRIARAAAAPLP